MRLYFLGTRGGITARSKEHYRQSTLCISYRNTALVLDWGSDWLSKKNLISDLSALLLTHAHPDHAGGITAGFPLPIYTTEDTIARHKHLQDAHIIIPRQPFSIGSLTIEAFPVHHSLNAPAVGYRITGGKRSLLYLPDVLSIIDPQEALTGLDLYIGDGAIITRTLLKRIKKGIPTGHSPLVEQLNWCATYKVPRALFTHCGTEIVTGNKPQIEKQIKELGRQVGVKASTAYDGLKLII